MERRPDESTASPEGGRRSALARRILAPALALAAAAAPSPASADVLYRSQMNTNSSWSLNANSADYAVSVHDYSADGIPEAPNSRVGDTATVGFKLEANLANGQAAVVSVYPVGESFSGDYQLRFDAWMNYDVDERINGGSAGTAEFIGGGTGYDDSSADIGVGAQMIATGDGGSGSDWRVFADSAFLDPAEMYGASRNGFATHYSDFLPGVVPPLAQSQEAFVAGTAGSPGFQWITIEINTVGGVGSVYIEKPDGERLLIAQINQDGSRPYGSNGNIRVIYADFFSSVSSRPDLTFGIVDNVVVTDDPVQLLFADGFEVGDTTRWFATVP